MSSMGIYGGLNTQTPSILPGEVQSTSSMDRNSSISFSLSALVFLKQISVQVAQISVEDRFNLS